MHLENTTLRLARQAMRLEPAREASEARTVAAIGLVCASLLILSLAAGPPPETTDMLSSTEAPTASSRS